LARVWTVVYYKLHQARIIYCLAFGSSDVTIVNSDITKIKLKIFISWNWEENTILVLFFTPTRSSLYVSPNSQWEWCKFQWSSIYHGLAPFVLLVALHKLLCGTYYKNWLIYKLLFQKVFIVGNKNFIRITNRLHSFLWQISYHKNVWGKKNLIFIYSPPLKKMGGKIQEPTNKITLT
jgi:hypothetical protein